ncbi:MAG: hypothetical protein RSD67_05550 [Oscillospiraceae bacterium]
MGGIKQSGEPYISFNNLCTSLKKSVTDVLKTLKEVENLKKSKKRAAQIENLLEQLDAVPFMFLILLVLIIPEGIANGGEVFPIAMILLATILVCWFSAFVGLRGIYQHICYLMKKRCLVEHNEKIA